MVGKVSLEVTPINDVQISNFGDDSFKITNLGDKKIAQIEIDVTNAIYGDSVFDPFGLAGDGTSKALTIDSDVSTGVIAPNETNYIGAGGSAGYRKLQLRFDDLANGGFESGESLGFSIDMDPNSVAGTDKDPLDFGSSPSWDVGGVSGAELIGSTFTVTFTDGTTASGQLQSDGNQGGAQALATEDNPNLSVELVVNGQEEGEIGTYDAGGPTVVLNGPAGETARVVLTKGFIQPVIPYAEFLAEQLEALAGTDFPANNAVEFQIVDILLTGEEQDISNLFNFADVEEYDFAGEAQLPLGFVASVIDPDNNNFALGEVSEPIYLQFSGSGEPPVVEPPSGGGDGAPPIAADIVIEAEDLDDVIGYRVDNNSIASGGSLLSLVGGSSSEVGVASFDFSGATGIYNVILGTFDENDGEASLEVALEGDVLGQVFLDEDLGSGVISEDNKLAQTVATNVAISNGDTLTITGQENVRDYAHFDYIAFNLVDADSGENPPAGPLTEVEINFGADSTEVSEGIIIDTGAAYDSERGYGWVKEGSAGSDAPVPIDVTVNRRDRNVLNANSSEFALDDFAKDTLIHLQYPEGLDRSPEMVTESVAWEYDIANGQYEVTVQVGDPSYTDSRHTINVEGQSVIADFVPTGVGEELFATASAVVEVVDGRLTVDAIGGENTKLNYISIVEV